MPRIDARRARTPARAFLTTATVLATPTLLLVLALPAPAESAERILLLLAAVPTAALLAHLARHLTGYVAEAAAGSPDHLQTAQQDIQRHLTHLRAAHRSTATTQPSSPALPPVSEPAPGPGTGSPVGGGHLATLARPPADQHPTR